MSEGDAGSDKAGSQSHEVTEGRLVCFSEEQPPEPNENGMPEELQTFLASRHRELAEKLDRWMAKEELMLAGFLKSGGTVRRPTGSTFSRFSESGQWQSSPPLAPESSVPVEKVPSSQPQKVFNTRQAAYYSSAHTRKQKAGDDSGNMRPSFLESSLPAHFATDMSQPKNREVRGLRAVVRSPIFEAISCGAIIANTIFMGIEVEHTSQLGRKGVSPSITATNIVFTAFFTLELLIRLGAINRDYCNSSEASWLAFDALLVLSGLVDTVIDVGLHIKGNTSFSSARVMRLLRVTRMIRVLRFAKLVRFIRDLRIMLFSIVHTLRTVAWAMVLLFTFIYVFAIVFTQANADHAEDIGGISTREGLFWGSLGSSVTTLLTAVTGGLDWREPLISLYTLHLVWFLIFIVFVLFTTFAILNVVTAAFCQGAIEGKQYDREQAVKDLLNTRHQNLTRAADLFQNMFMKIDSNADGDISWEEFREHIQDDSVQALLVMLELEESDLWVLFQMLDSSGMHRLTPQDFIQGCMRLKGGARSIDLARHTHEAREIFKLLVPFMESQIAETAKVRSEVRLALSMLKSRGPGAPPGVIVI